MNKFEITPTTPMRFPLAIQNLPPSTPKRKSSLLMTRLMKIAFACFAVIGTTLGYYLYNGEKNIKDKMCKNPFVLISGGIVTVVALVAIVYSLTKRTRRPEELGLDNVGNNQEKTPRWTPQRTPLKTPVNNCHADKTLSQKKETFLKYCKGTFEIYKSLCEGEQNEEIEEHKNRISSTQYNLWTQMNEEIRTDLMNSLCLEDKLDYFYYFVYQYDPAQIEEEIIKKNKELVIFLPSRNVGVIENYVITYDYLTQDFADITDDDRACFKEMVSMSFINAIKNDVYTIQDFFEIYKKYVTPKHSQLPREKITIEIDVWNCDPIETLKQFEEYKKKIREAAIKHNQLQVESIITGNVNNLVSLMEIVVKDSEVKTKIIQTFQQEKHQKIEKSLDSNLYFSFLSKIGCTNIKSHRT